MNRKLNIKVHSFNKKKYIWLYVRIPRMQKNKYSIYIEYLQIFKLSLPVLISYFNSDFKENTAYDSLGFAFLSENKFTLRIIDTQSCN